MVSRNGSAPLPSSATRGKSLKMGVLIYAIGNDYLEASVLA